MDDATPAVDGAACRRAYLALVAADQATFCLLDGLGLVVVGQHLASDRPILANRVAGTQDSDEPPRSRPAALAEGNALPVDSARASHARSRAAARDRRRSASPVSSMPARTCRRKPNHDPVTRVEYRDLDPGRGRYDAATRTVTAQVDHLSLWSVLRIDAGKLLAKAAGLIGSFVGVADQVTPPTCPNPKKLTGSGV